MVHVDRGHVAPKWIEMERDKWIIAHSFHLALTAHWIMGKRVSLGLLEENSIASLKVLLIQAAPKSISAWSSPT